MARILFMWLVLMVSLSASAACQCVCVGGAVRALCTGALDLPPICAPQICPLVPPSIAPIQAPTIPPIGTQSCQQRQVVNPYTGQYQWRTVCQ